ncbi:PAS domain-containing protein [Halobacillus litoralis]|uniref:PAS domain-containing protein n=1 Tax=Halobacillus litoralis TaxID=45668 RepID=UPI001CFE9552|nr:STAS domain-containing protein [Halobacillus litoralis]WLR47343.1 PAS domain-containing protein [Halobacillus litoralis]
MTPVNEVFDQLSLGVMAIDLDYQITHINQQGACLLQVKEEDVLGKNVYDLFPNAPEEVRHVERTVRTSEEFTFEAIPYQWGKYNLYLSIRTRLLKENGKVNGAMVEYSDVTDFYDKEQRMMKWMEDMSVNVIPLSNGIVLLPLQPIMDQIEFQYILDRGIHNVTQMGAHQVIIDCSTITTVDHVFFEKLSKLIQSLSLMGVQTTISGMKPILSKTWVSSNLPTIKVKFYSNLQVALKNLYNSVR